MPDSARQAFALAHAANGALNAMGAAMRALMGCRQGAKPLLDPDKRFVDCALAGHLAHLTARARKAGWAPSTDKHRFKGTLE
jgi:2-methylcitrate dehydratase PrpD